MKKKIFGFFDKKKNTITERETEREITEVNYPAEDLAVIAMAIHLHTTQMHDEESEIITFEDFSRPYSPWSQKHLLFKNNLYRSRRR